MSTFTLFIIALLNVTKIRFSLSALLLAVFLIIFMTFVSLFNDNLPYEIWIFRLCRYTMLILVVLICNWFFEQKQYNIIFWKIFNVVVFVGLFYGIYQFFAPQYGLPYLLNVFSNNPSFTPRDIDYYYGGWIEYPRIYGVFSEPSFYSGFLALFYITLLYIKNYSYWVKNVFFLLLSINLLLTFSRVGYFVFGSILIVHLVFETVHLQIRKKLGYCVGFFIISIPLLMPLIMNYLYQNEYYLDASASGRTISQIYYLQQSFENFRIIGYGLGSIKNLAATIASAGDIEGFAHNGLVQLSYEIGLVFIVFYYLFMFRLLRRSFNFRYIFIVVTAIATLVSFGEFYSIESILILMCALIKSEPHRNALN